MGSAVFLTRQEDDDVDQQEMVSFEIISNTGTARSCFIEAIRLAREGKYQEAQLKMEMGDKNFIAGHAAHMKLLQLDQSDPVSLLVIHAEDQLMSAETFKILAQEFIEMYKSKFL